MSHHKHHSHHKHRGPSGGDILADFAAGMLMGAVAAHAESKHHYAERGKINPYAVSAMKMGAGRMHTTNDILRTGAMLGALGAFDDVIFAQGNAGATHDYDWRDYCTCGLDYGVDPEDYDKVEDFEMALAKAIAEGEGDDLDELLAEADEGGEEFSREEYADGNEGGKESSEEEYADGDDSGETREWDPFNDDDFKVYTYCKVRLSDSGQARFYRTEDATLWEGSVVMVPSPDGSGAVRGEIISVKKYPKCSVPQDVEKTPEIIGLA